MGNDQIKRAIRELQIKLDRLGIAFNALAEDHARVVKIIQKLQEKNK